MEHLAFPSLFFHGIFFLHEVSLSHFAYVTNLKHTPLLHSHFPDTQRIS